ncbi:MAG: hypothetical protein Q9168_005881 [Polycauliona sp. 1 TL-2023]
MQLHLVLISLLGYVCCLSSATALTYKLHAHEYACFFANAPEKGLKIAFYFAVQSGGSFDIDFSVVGPDLLTIILEGSKERQGDFVFTAKEAGEHRFCFNNGMSTFAEKMVDFEISVRIALRPLSPKRRLPLNGQSLLHLITFTNEICLSQVENESKNAKLPSKQGTSPEQTSALEESILKVSRDLSTINRNQKYFRTRENRNMSTVKSTESRIFNFSVMESLLMISMAGLQVFIVRFFFQGARKGKTPPPDDYH